MPDLNPYSDVAVRKFYLADLAYQLNERKIGEKIVNQITNYASGQLNYYASVDDNNQRMAGRDIQLDMSVINEMVKLTKDNNEPALNQKLTGLLNTYQAKFGAMFQQQQPQ